MPWIFPDIETSTEWFNAHSVAFQVHGADIVHLSDIDEETGWATLTVFTSTHPDARILFTGQVNIYERGPEGEDG